MKFLIAPSSIKGVLLEILYSGKLVGVNSIYITLKEHKQKFS